MSSTFGSLTTVRLGIYAAQKGLDVTGNNITNINTNGYTRQRLDQVSLITSAADKTGSQYNSTIGQGAVISGISQLRDPGLDIAYRNARANTGAADQTLAGLERLAGILDEVGKGDGDQDDGMILSQLNDLRDLINQALTNGMKDYEGSIRSSAKALAGLFNQYASELEGLQQEFETEFEQDVGEVNRILTELRDLNLQIRDADIRGDAALELRDTRNLLLDKLSQYMKIHVTYSNEDVGAGLIVEKMTVSLGTGDKHTLVDGEYATQLTADMAGGNYDIALEPLADEDGSVQNGSVQVALGDTELYGSLQSLRELLTEKGEYADASVLAVDPDAGTKRGIPYYMAALDSFAATFAAAMNELNEINGDPNPLFSNSGNGNETDGITASNISVSKGWTDGSISMVVGDPSNPDAPSDDRSNLAKFLNIFSEEHEYTTGTGTIGESTPYSGSFEDMLLRIESTLAEDQMATTAVLNNYAVTEESLAGDRESVSGVDLNDEATSLMIYQKAYTAACRVMTVMEEVLDTLINSTAI